MSLFSKIEHSNHEQIAYCYDRRAGLKAIIAIHNTQLGPAIGGCRMLPYATEEEALTDVLRLSRGMTYKNAVANLNFGGGKSVIIGDPSLHGSEVLFRSFGRFVQSLSGRYITAEDSGTSASFMEWVRLETDHVIGIPGYMGGSGDPSPFTAQGVFVGMKAALKKLTGKENLSGVKVAVQGIGNVGYNLCQLLHKAQAKLYVHDVVSERVSQAVKDFGAKAVDAHEIYDLDVDIYAPCALGATLNDVTLPKLKCAIIAGGANNQLAEEVKHSEALKNAGILYVPDYVINAGGVISCANELTGGSQEYVLSQVERIYETILNVFAISETQGITTAEASRVLAEKRLNNVAALKNMHLGCV